MRKILLPLRDAAKIRNINIIKPSFLARNMKALRLDFLTGAQYNREYVQRQSRIGSDPNTGDNVGRPTAEWLCVRGVGVQHANA
jgi:hypothetical protein